MELIQKIIAILSGHKVEVVLGVIIAIDHALAAIPGVEASSTYQGITAILDKIKSALFGSKKA